MTGVEPLSVSFDALLSKDGVLGGIEERRGGVGVEEVGESGQQGVVVIDIDLVYEEERGRNTNVLSTL